MVTFQLQTSPYFISYFHSMMLPLTNVILEMLCSGCCPKLIFLHILLVGHKDQAGFHSTRTPSKIHEPFGCFSDYCSLYPICLLGGIVLVLVGLKNGLSIALNFSTTFTQFLGLYCLLINVPQDHFYT